MIICNVGTVETRVENDEHMADENDCKSEMGEDESDVKYENHSSKDVLEEAINDEIILPKVSEYPDYFVTTQQND